MIRSKKVELPEYAGIVEQDSLIVNEFISSSSNSRADLIVYYTYSCGYCEIMHKNLTELKTEFKDQISISYNPLYIHEGDQDFIKAKYTLCAHKFGLFGDVEKLLFKDADFKELLRNKLGENNLSEISSCSNSF